MYTGSDTAAGESGATRSSPAALRSELAYGELKSRLLDGEFRLNGRLVEERLAAELGVSRTPVREALARLHAEGLVARWPDGGFVPALPDPAGMRHLYEVRIGLEMLGLRRPIMSAGRHDIPMLVELHDEWQLLAEDAPAGSDPSFVHLDESFHVTLAESSGNPAIADLLRQINDRIRVVRMQDFVDPDRITQTAREHVGIVEAVIRGDLVDAEARFSSHLERSLLVVEQRVALVMARMARGADR